jgi:uncharacterized protein YecE (DUF72 family)
MLRIGTCSWKYPSWAGLVYSKPSGINYLAEYAGKYNTVEVDQWFWSLFPGGKIRLPDPQDVEAYAASVGPDFRFTVKAPNSLTLTHGPKGHAPSPAEPNPRFLSLELFSDFLARLEPIHPVLGPILFQFGYLNRRNMASQALLEKALEGFRRGLPPGFQYGVEIRNGNFLNGRFLAFLHDHGFLPVLLQGYWMPPIAQLYAEHQECIRSFHALVLRLHGPDREGIEAETGKEWNRIVHPRDEELQGLARMTSELLEAGAEVVVNANNHYEGCAPLTIERFLACGGF